MKIRLSRTLFVALFLLVPYSKAQVPQPSPSPAPLTESSKRVRDSYREALAAIAANHVSGSKLDVAKVTAKSMDSMVRVLDPHSSYLDAKESAEYRASINSRYFGIGALIAELRDRNLDLVGTFVRVAYEGSPAHGAGLRFGDQIVEVNGVSLLGKSSAETREHLLGPRGTNVKVIIERDGQRLTFDIVRDAIPQPPIPDAYVIRPRVGYVAMTGGISADLGAETQKALARLRAEGIDFLILDVRNNGGGLMVEACKVLTEFLSNGELIFQTASRRPEVTRSCTSRNNSPNDLPVIVLANHATVSAAEYIAGSLQDLDRALVVGENTYGKGVIQGTFVLDGGTQLHLTVSRFQSAIGRKPQRDYGDSLYKYETQGAGRETMGGPLATTSGPSFTTPTGRLKHGGGGIEPDLLVKPEMLYAGFSPRVQARLISAALAFAMALTSGKVKGSETLALTERVDYDHVLKGDEFLVSDQLFQAFKGFAIENYGLQGPQLDRSRKETTRNIRNDLLTAAYGPRIALRIAREYDPQIQKSFELFPRAQELWSKSKVVLAAKPKK